MMRDDIRGWIESLVNHFETYEEPEQEDEAVEDDGFVHIRRMGVRFSFHVDPEQRKSEAWMDKATMYYAKRVDDIISREAERLKK